MNPNDDPLSPTPCEAPADRPRHLRPVAGLLLLGAFCWIFFVRTAFHGILINDGYNYAASARNFLAGKGFLWETHGVQEYSGLPDGRVVSREGMSRTTFPSFLYPLLLAPAIAWIGPNDGAIALVGGLFFVALIPAIYLLAFRLYGAAAGMLAGALTALNAKMLYYSISGDPLPLYAFLLALAVLFLVTGRSWKALFVGGLCAALIAWTKEVGAIVAATIVAFAVVVRWREFGPKALAAVVGALAMAGLLSIARPLLNPPLPPAPPPTVLEPASAERPPAPATPRRGALAQAASLWLSRALIFSDERPGHTFERSLDARSGFDIWRGHLGSLAAKMGRNAREVARVVLYQVTQPVLVWLFWAGGIIFLRHALSRRLFALTLLLFLVQGGVCAVLFVMHRYFHVFIPLMIVPAAGLLDRGLAALRRGRPGRRVAAAFLGVLAVVALSYPWCVTAGVDREHRACDAMCWFAARVDGPRLARLGAFIREKTPPDEVVVTDAPWIAWWHGDRTSVWIPVDMPTLQALQRRVRVDWLLLTFEYWREMETWKDWLRGAGDAGGSLDGFRFVSAFVEDDYRAYLFKAESIPARAPDLPSGDPAGR